ncbi:helix-turn-helix transcriptional regulator, partial [Leucobacter sp. M11]|uniref:helix-turn-helix transcriptional regulator n=1 Tax=Leucobacter sp. M11 TaxID=2993565 RepID=UPI002D89848E|nr:WYL domain-containing protein [Leucobacter sp. M11]
MPETPLPRRPRAVPGEQRVFSVILALVAAPQGLTKRELLSSVYGYAERFATADPASLERQFERDKDTLRELGVPLEVLESPDAVGNNQLLRYRIAKDRLQLPEGIAFSADEVTLLKLASLAWQEGSLSDQSRRATMKLEALGAALDPRHLGVAPRIGSPEPVAQRLHQAIQARRTVRFGYRH